MPLFRRYDGDLVRSKAVDIEHRTMPFLMPTRTESVVYTDFQLDPAPVQRYVEQRNQGAETKITPYILALCAMGRALTLRPKMNRFFVGGHIYQRKWLDISFSMKVEKTEKSIMRAVKVRYEPSDTLETFSARVLQVLDRGRDLRPTADEKEMKLALLLPAFLLRFAVWLLRWLDFMNLMPSAMIRNDPLYTSIFVANLGSLGMPAPYHHLYEWGTAPIFTSIGKSEKVPVVQDDRVVVKEMMPFRVTYDERCIDGLYAGKAIDLFKEFLADPKVLETPVGDTIEEPKKAANS